MSDGESLLGGCGCCGFIIGAFLIYYLLSAIFSVVSEFLHNLGIFFQNSGLFILATIGALVASAIIIIIVVYCCNAWKSHGYPTPSLPQLPRITLGRHRQPQAITNNHNNNNIVVVINGGEEGINLIRRPPIEEPAPNPSLRITEIINEEAPTNQEELGQVPNNVETLPTEFQCVICFENYSLHEDFIFCKPFEIYEDIFPLEIHPHRICIDCIRGYSHAAIEDVNLAPGGIGLKCADPNCTNVLHFADFKLYLSPEDHEQLEKRMQHESITSATLTDLVTCSSCSLQFCVEEGFTFFTCEECGRIQCRNCPRPYDANHQGKTCEEVDEKMKNGNRIESKLSEIVVRVCHRCNVQYVKRDGCNKMTCRCGATQCYICRQNNINYTHFCDCGPQNIHGKCTKCKKSCRLFENAEELDETKIKEASSSKKTKKK